MQVPEIQPRSSPPKHVLEIAPPGARPTLPMSRRPCAAGFKKPGLRSLYMRCTGFSRTEFEQCLRHVHGGGAGPGPATAPSSSAPSTLAGPRLVCWPRGLPWPARASCWPWVYLQIQSGHGLSMNTRAHRAHSHIYAVAWSPGCRNIMHLGDIQTHQTSEQVNKAKDGTHHLRG